MEFIKEMVYKFLISSGIVWYLMPIVKKYVVKSNIQPSNCNHRILDDEGCSMTAFKLDDKLLPPYGLHNFSKIKNLKIRDNDVLICGYPKTGCHWTFEIVHMLLNRSASLSKYGKVFEGYMEFLPEFVLDSLPSPRVLNTHLSYDELPDEIKAKKTKIVLTTRCPKDTVVSYFNHIQHLKVFNEYGGNFDNFFKLFMKGQMYHGSYYDNASDWRQVITSPTTANPIFVMKYEELKSDPEEMVKKLSRFLNLEMTDTFIGEVTRTQFKSLKTAAEKDPFISGVFRKGIVGDWKNWLSEEQSAAIVARKEVLLG